MGRSIAEKGWLSPSGNRTQVFRVTGGDTVHYTNEEMCMQGLAPDNDTAPTAVNKACLFPMLAQPLHHKIPARPS